MSKRFFVFLFAAFAGSRGIVHREPLHQFCGDLDFGDIVKADPALLKISDPIGGAYVACTLQKYLLWPKTSNPLQDSIIRSKNAVDLHLFGRKTQKWMDDPL